MFKKNCAYI